MTREEKINTLKAIIQECEEYEWLRRETLFEIIKDLEQEPTTKHDLAQERYQDLIEYFGDEKVAKTILESRKEFKAWLERLRWNVKRADELARELEQIKGTTKNDLGVDYISRQAVLELLEDTNNGWIINEVLQMPPVTPQEPITWIVGKNNAQIAVKNMPIDKLQKICAIIGDEQEPILDKIRAEIKALPTEHTAYGYDSAGELWTLKLISSDSVLEILDKYNAEMEKI